MTDATDRLALPLLAAGQAQKEMYHNEALLRLDMMTQAAAEGFGTDAPPTEPHPGQCWIIGDAPEGDWTGHAGEIAGWSENGWRFVTPREGMQLWLGETAGFALFRSGIWQCSEAYGRLFVEGVQIVGSRADGIAEPVGGTVVDAEARAAVSAVLVALRVHGLIEPDGL
ncbi:DUF2793 domain-containing protein [Sphingomonas sp. HITSZ_GF]|uniref:DUF2793 domain-containing protein n=1 Tax=Sphingomonas sp. HITSZ_GF TaxID=3037247 RepID=UPI00240CF4AE|nr:DUF2793 domain-containing protein [Sphingomonas sp. HITSZ_GF]MDG2534470.1 DUF2793 domain-containing protein [Sphingomonas sp. HITSZ_GF]